jgi:hypothetical protein
VPDDVCVRCGHGESETDYLGLCQVAGCSCLAFVSEADELEAELASGEGPEELYLGDDGA